MRKRIGLIIRTVLVVIAAAAATFSLVLVSTSPHMWDENITSDVTRANGMQTTSDNGVLGLMNKGDTAVVHVQLPEDQRIDDATFCFYAYHCVINATYDGQLLYSYGQDLADSNTMIGVEYVQVSIPEEAWGHSFDITLESMEDSSISKISDTRVYPTSLSFRYAIDLNPLAFLLSITGLVLSVIALFLLFIRGEWSKTTRKAGYIALFAFIASLWVFACNGMFTIFGWSTLWSTVEYCCLFLIPAPLLLYLLVNEPRGRSHALLIVLKTITIAFAVISILLHVLNVIHLCAFVPIAHTLLFVDCIGLLWVLWKGKNRMGGNRTMLLGGTVLIVFAMVDTVRFNIMKMLPSATPNYIPSILPIGLIIFLICLIFAYYVDLEDEHTRTISLESDLDRMRMMIGAIPAGIAVFRLSQTAIIEDANARFYELLGFDNEEEGHASVHSIFDMLGENDARTIRSMIDKALRVGMNDGQMELSVHMGNGKVTDVLILYHINLANRLVTVNVIDITERNAIARKLDVREQDYRAAIEISGRLYMSYDISSRTVEYLFGAGDNVKMLQNMPNIPDSLIEAGVLTEETASNTKAAFDSIINGIPAGIFYMNSIATEAHPSLWWRCEWHTVYDTNDVPLHALLSFENVTGQHEHELAYQRVQQELEEREEGSYTTFECNITRDTVEGQKGDAFKSLMPLIGNRGMQEATAYVAEQFIHPDYQKRFTQFMQPQRFIRCLQSGQHSDSIVVRGVLGEDEPVVNILEDGTVQPNNNAAWYMIHAQLIADPYSSDVKAFITFEDIDEDKRRLLQMEQDIKVLQDQLEDSRTKVMTSQMQPHFLYNALSAIRTIVHIDPDYAYDLLYDFTVHLRSSVRALSSDDPIPFESELANIKAYLNIEKMRFGDALNIEYDIQCTDFVVVPLSIQPLAENAARHGVYPKGKDGGTVIVRTYETDDAYVVEVADDGVGFDFHDTLKQKNDSVGLKSLIFRLNSLMDASVAVDSKIGQGTVVRVTIPKTPESTLKPIEE